MHQKHPLLLVAQNQFLFFDIGGCTPAGKVIALPTFWAAPFCLVATTHDFYVKLLRRDRKNRYNMYVVATTHDICQKLLRRGALNRSRQSRGSIKSCNLPFNSPGRRPFLISAERREKRAGLQRAADSQTGPFRVCGEPEIYGIPRS